MKSFGNALGNCLNDKDYVRLVGCRPRQPPKYDLAEAMNCEAATSGLKEARLRALRGHMNRNKSDHETKEDLSANNKENCDLFNSGIETPKSSQGSCTNLTSEIKSAPPPVTSNVTSEQKVTNNVSTIEPGSADLSKIERLKKAKMKHN